MDIQHVSAPKAVANRVSKDQKLRSRRDLLCFYCHAPLPPHLVSRHLTLSLRLRRGLLKSGDYAFLEGEKCLVSFVYYVYVHGAGGNALGQVHQLIFSNESTLPGRPTYFAEEWHKLCGLLPFPSIPIRCEEATFLPLKNSSIVTICANSKGWKTSAMRDHR